MVLKLQEIGKRFNRDWIFKDIKIDLPTGLYAILGGNGSGKSTLLKILSGANSPTQGKVILELNDNSKLEKFDLLPHLAFAAPYIEFPEELSLREFFDFANKIKPYQEDIDFKTFTEKLLFVGQEDKTLKYFSSGMKQRLRLGHVFFSNCSVLIFDEPSSNLDTNGLQWYQDLLNNYGQNKIVIVGSNFIKGEYVNASKTIMLQDYK